MTIFTDSKIRRLRKLLAAIEKPTELVRTLIDKEPDVLEYCRKSGKAIGIKSTQVLYDAVYGKRFCETCEKPVAFISVFAGYKAFCSNYCVGTNKQIMEQKKKTCRTNHGTDYPQQAAKVRKKTVAKVRALYGVDNVSNAKVVQKKRTKTFMEKYGVDNPRKASSVKETIRRTNIARFGCHPMQTAEIQQKQQDAILSKYGETNSMFVEAVKKKQAKTNMKRYGAKSPFGSPLIREKIAAINLEKYGNEHPMRTDKIKRKLKRSVRAKYGVPYTSQVPEIAERILNGNKTTEVVYGRKMFSVRGYEHFALSHFKKLRVGATNIVNSVEEGMPTFRYGQKKKLYVPDFLLKRNSTVVEVKSCYTVGLKHTALFKMTLAKAKAVERDGWKYQLLVFDKNGNLRIQLDTSKFTQAELNRLWSQSDHRR